MFGFKYGTIPDTRVMGHKLLVEWVKEIRKLPFAPRILDYGCGPGHASAVFREFIPDANLKMADIADTRKNCPDDPFFLLPTDSPKIPSADGSIDIFFASEGLEHVPNLLGTLLEIHRVLSPKGYLVGSVPNFSNIHSRLCFWRGEGYRDMARLPEGRHLNFITRQFFPKLDAFAFGLDFNDSSSSSYFKLVREGGDADFIEPYCFMPSFLRHEIAKTEKRRMGYGRVNSHFSCLSYDYLFVFKKLGQDKPDAAPALLARENERRSLVESPNVVTQGDSLAPASRSLRALQI